MIMDEIEAILGRHVVEAIEDAVRAGFAAAQANGNRETGASAVRELLISLLAAAVITPRDGAQQRADAAAGRLKDLVAASLSDGGRSKLN